MKRLVLALALAGLQLPAAAQTVVASIPENDPRIAAARPVIDKIWPLGTYRRMMDGTMGKMMDQMMESMLGMKASDLAAMDPSGKAAKEAGDLTMAQAIAEKDPHFRERLKLTMDTMMGEMVPLLTKSEPAIRDSLVKIYARHFSAEQLGDMSRFFATISGRAYADKAMLVFMEPEMIQAMQSFTPELIKAMPEIMKKVENATAHLPPPPKDKGKSDQ